MQVPGKKPKKQDLTLMVPENYPRGDFMLFEESGDTKELGRGNESIFLTQL